MCLREKFGDCALKWAIEMKNNEAFYMITKYAYKECNKYDYCAKILMSLLEKQWFDEFKFFLNISSMDPIIFFNTIFAFHFPFAELCTKGCEASVIYLLQNYSYDTLHIKCDLYDDSYLDNFFTNEYSFKKELRTYITCPEQEIAWCLLSQYCSPRN